MLISFECKGIDNPVTKDYGQRRCYQMADRANTPIVSSARFVPALLVQQNFKSFFVICQNCSDLYNSQERLYDTFVICI